jgi:FkbM family methyltransferase
MNFVQIGAGAGDLDARLNNRDGFSEYVKSLDPAAIDRIILVEPNPVNLPALAECWRDYPQAVIYNLGICLRESQNRTITFYWTDRDAPHYQVFSMNPDHVAKHYPGEPLRTTQVKCIDLASLIQQTLGAARIDLLALDIEGIDAEIILDTDWGNINCDQLSFEHLHLGDRAHVVVAKLNYYGYTYQGTGVDHNGYDWMFRNSRNT